MKSIETILLVVAAFYNFGSDERICKCATKVLDYLSHLMRTINRSMLRLYGSGRNASWV